jgi:hypothetical protein
MAITASHCKPKQVGTDEESQPVNRTGGGGKKEHGCCEQSGNPIADEHDHGRDRQVNNAFGASTCYQDTAPFHFSSQRPARENAGRAGPLYLLTGDERLATLSFFVSMLLFPGDKHLPITDR